jgi:Flp pilus assembly protein TadD
LLAGERERALKVWSEGFAGLPDTTLVVALSLHQDPQGAVARWQQLLEFDGAFVAPGRFRQKNGWWVLLVSDPKNRRADLSVAATRLGLRAGVVQVARLRLPPEGPVQTARAGTDAKQAATSGRESAAKVAVASPQAEAIARDFDAEAVPVLAALERRSSDVIVLADGLVRDFPDRIEPLVWRARAQLLAGQPVDAERTLLEVLSRSPTMVEAWLLRGIAAQERGDHQNALVFFEEALRLAPRNVDALYNIAFSAQQMGDVTRARSAAVKFLSLTQGNPAYANQRSWVEQQLR